MQERGNGKGAKMFVQFLKVLPNEVENGFGLSAGKKDDSFSFFVYLLSNTTLELDK